MVEDTDVESLLVMGQGGVRKTKQWPSRSRQCFNVVRLQVIEYLSLT